MGKLHKKDSKKAFDLLPFTVYATNTTAKNQRLICIVGKLEKYIHKNKKIQIRKKNCNFALDVIY